MKPAGRTAHIIRVSPVLLAECEPDRPNERKLVVLSRDEEHCQILRIQGELEPAMYPAIARIGTQWLLQSIVNRLHREDRARRRR